MLPKKASGFFTPEERQRIEAVVEAMEKRTSGEIVPMVVDQSYDYPGAEYLGAAFFSIGAAALLTWLFGQESMWILLLLLLVLYFPSKILIRFCPPLKRLLISPLEMSAEVEEKAKVAFLEQGLHRTRDETGILILLSLFEKRVFVLADRGINKVVPEHTWDEVVKIVVDGIHRRQTCEALCLAIERCGKLLETPIPVRPDDTDELPNLILE